MEIPRNDNNVHAEQVESAMKFVLDEFSSGADYVQLPWTEFKYSVAKDVACKFLSRGYHARA